MADKKIIVVFGATGAQGGSVTRALMTDPAYKVRGITRNPDSKSSKALIEKGCEMVTANLDDIETLKKAFEGAYGAYVVTNYWEHLDGAKDTQQGKNAVDAAKACGVKHFIYSGLEDVNKIMGKECHHFDSKAKVEAYLKEVGLPHTSTRMSFYMENLLTFLKPMKNDDGEWVLGIPMEGAAMDMLAVSEVGECIHQVLNKPDEFLGKHIGLSGEKLTIVAAAETITKATGTKFVATPITTEMFGKFPFPGAAENAIMFEFYIKCNPERDTALTKKLNPATPNFEEWCTTHKDTILKSLE